MRALPVNFPKTAKCPPNDLRRASPRGAGGHDRRWTQHRGSSNRRLLDLPVVVGFSWPDGYEHYQPGSTAVRLGSGGNVVPGTQRKATHVSDSCRRQLRGPEIE